MPLRTLVVFLSRSRETRNLENFYSLCDLYFLYRMYRKSFKGLAVRKVTTVLNYECHSKFPTFKKYIYKKLCALFSNNLQKPRDKFLCSFKKLKEYLLHKPFQHSSKNENRISSCSSRTTKHGTGVSSSCWLLHIRTAHSTFITASVDNMIQLDVT